MNSMFFVVCIVAIGCATAVLTEYFKSKAKREKQSVGADTMAQIDALEERIRVLERIVTQKRFDLRQEIDEL